MKTKLIQKTCRYCKTKFKIPAWENRRRDRKFCSINCHKLYLSSFVDESFFSTSNSNMAYVLGLIYTDGCLLTRACGTEFVSIKSIDKQMLTMVNKMMKSSYGVYKCGLSQAGNMVYRIDFANKQIVDDVKRWGITARKTLTTKFPALLPKEYYPDFIRGLFDGDGGVYLFHYKYKKDAYQCMILGTKELLKPIPYIINVDTTIKPYKNISKMVFYAYDKMKRFSDFIYYNDNVPCLKRKKKDFDRIMAYGKRSADRRKMNKALKENTKVKI